MARYATDHKAQTRADIVARAAEMVRTQGLDGTGVAQVMKAAGLTHGGFYAHFDGKEALLAAAVAEAIAPSSARLAMLAEKAGEAGDAGLIPTRYLAAERAANIATGCAAAALASELHRAPDDVRAAFQSGAVKSAQTLDADGLGWARYAMLVGALALLRAVPDEGVQDDIRANVADAFRRLVPAA